jgi:hypothetical protein
MTRLFTCGFLSLACAGGVLAAAGCDIKVSDKGEVNVDLVEGRASDEWTRTYKLPKDGQVEIFNGVGPLEAFPATGNDVEIIIRREVRARSDEAAAQVLKELQVEEDVTPARVKVESRRSDQMRGFRQNVRLEYRVNLPPGLNVSLKSENGMMRLENIQGRITASATNGGIAGRGLSGPLEATIVNGGINIDLAAVSGNITLSSVNGAIRLFVPADINATLEATAVNGGVNVDERLVYKATERGRTRVVGQFNAGGPKITLNSTNGPIRVGPTGPEPPAEMRGELRERRSP